MRGLKRKLQETGVEVNELKSKLTVRCEGGEEPAERAFPSQSLRTPSRGKRGGFGLSYRCRE
jgi:hypothetical protein